MEKVDNLWCTSRTSLKHVSFFLFQVKEEVQIKKEPLEEEPSGSGGRGRPVGNVNGGKGIRARSDGSSPSREVQDILGDSEEQGGLGAEIVVTEEPYDDDDLVDIDEEEDDDGDGGGGGGGGDENLFASAAKAALNLTDPGRGASETKADAATSLNKSAGWPGMGMTSRLATFTVLQ